MTRTVYAVALFAAMSFLAPARAQPVLNVLSPTPGTVYHPQGVALFFLSDGASFECAVDLSPIVCVPDTLISLAGLAGGAHRVEILARDASGAASAASVQFIVDATAPTIGDITMTPSLGETTGPNPAFSFQSDSDLSNAVFDCRVDGMPIECRPGEPFQFPFQLFDGTGYSLHIVATDFVGNRSAATFSFNVDSRGPVFDPAATVAPGESPVCPRSTPETQIRWESFDPSRPVRYRCSLDGGPLGPCNAVSGQAPNFPWRCLPNGQHTLTVLGYDFFDNASVPLSLRLVVDPQAVRTLGGQCPVNACAGPDRAADEGAPVALDGSLSTFDALVWTQIGGPQVSLSSTSAVAPSLTTPALSGRSGSQVLTFQLEARIGADADLDTVDVTVRNGNLAPEAHASAEPAVKEASSVTLSGLPSFDPDGDAIAAYEWTQTGGAAVALSSAGAAQPTFTAPTLAGGIAGTETLAFQLRVSDGVLWSAPASVSVVVEQVDHAPVADAGPDQTRTEGALVTLDGSASSDADGDGLAYAWTQISGEAVVLADSSSATPSFTAPQVPAGGSTRLGFQLAVSDSRLSSTAQVSVTVQDSNDPPSCGTARPTRAYLWPPNHRMAAVGIDGVTDRDNGRIGIAITGVSQDEPVNDTGDGDTSPDAVLQGASVLLRAERAAGGNGRVYQVRFTASDGQGGSCGGTVQVVVPATAAPGSIVNDGAVYDSTAR
jgi:hypothetical protein